MPTGRAGPPNSDTNSGFTQSFNAVATCIGGGIRPAVIESPQAEQETVARDVAAARAAKK